MRPSPFTSYLGNYNGDAPTMNAPSHVAPDTAWQDEFLRDRPHCYPTLVAWRGYIPFHPEQRHYYLAADGWRDTETDAAWVIDVLVEEGRTATAKLDATLEGLAAA